MFKLQVVGYRALMWVLKWAVKVIPQPKPLLFVGEGSALQLASNIGAMGATRVLIVTDRVIHDLGMLAPLQARLSEAGVQWLVFDEVLPDPSFELVEAGMAQARLQRSDAILAVGGGSSIDAAKMIAVGLTNHKPLLKLAGLLKVSRAGLPLYAVPTTAGTGSEVTMAAVISNQASGQKETVIDPKLMPVSAALDPALMTGLPAPITAATGIDALTHGIEAYISGHANAETDRYARAAVRLIFKYLPIAYRDGGNLQAREALALASCYAGLAFTKANLGYVHAVAHQLGAQYHLPHGLANALVLPHVLDFYGASAQPRLAELALEIGITPSGPEKQAEAFIAKAFIERVRALIAELELPRHTDKLVGADIPVLAGKALKEAHYLYPVPRYMDQRQCENLISGLQAQGASD